MAATSQNGVVTRDSGGYGRLDRGVILDAALRVAARPGVADIRVRDLGEELGADPTAVYRHFRNKADLVAALIDRLMTDVTDALPAGEDWRGMLHAIAAGALDAFVAHPAVGIHLTEARSVGLGELRLVEVCLRTLGEAGLSDDALIEHYSAFSGLLVAYVASACRERIASELEDIPWIPLAADPTPAEFPALTRHGEKIFALDYRSTYFAGVRVLIDAIGRAAGESL